MPVKETIKNKVIEFQEYPNSIGYIDLTNPKIQNLVIGLRSGKLSVSRFLKLVSKILNLDLSNNTISYLSKHYYNSIKKYEVYEVSPSYLKSEEYQSFGDNDSCFVNDYLFYLDKAITPYWLDFMDASLYLVYVDGKPQGRFLGLPVIIEYEGKRSKTEIYFNFYGVEKEQFFLILKKINPNCNICFKKFYNSDWLYLNGNSVYIPIEGYQDNTEFGDGLRILVKCPCCDCYVDFSEMRRFYIVPKSRKPDYIEFAKFIIEKVKDYKYSSDLYEKYYDKVEYYWYDNYCPCLFCNEHSCNSCDRGKPTEDMLWSTFLDIIDDQEYFICCRHCTYL